MPDSARIAQATILEVPVTIQGSQTVEGTERREMFTETTKTTLVFEKGAAIKLKARVVAGQSLFLRNELSGKEVLCRVIEVPVPGQPGPTELEFTAREPGFWAVPAEEPAAALQESGKQESAEAAPENAVTAPGMESSAPSSGPTAVPETPAAPLSPLSPEAAEASSAPAAGTELNDARYAEQLAGMVAKDAKALAKRASAAKPAIEAAPAPATEQGEVTSGTPHPAKALSPLALRLHGIRTYTLRKNPIAFGIAALALVGTALGVAWHVRSSLSIHRVNQPSPAASHSSTLATTTQPAPKTPPPALAEEHPIQITKNSSATTMDAGAASESRKIESSALSAAPGPEASGSVRNSALPGSEPESRRKPAEPIVRHVSPARVLSQTQPPLPSWAKALDLGDMVTLDAVIDERGNVASATRLSGPPLLERAAKDAVQLWIFEPTISNGKPIPTHLILTVEFQR